MKFRPIIIATFAFVLLGAAVGGGTFIGRNLNASPPSGLPAQVTEGEFPLTFQGVLLDEDGAAVSNSSHTLNFAIYNDPDISTTLWRETQTVFTLNGLFTVELGVKEEIEPEIFSNNPETWLGIRVDEDEEMTPRIRLAYSPYAIHSLTADNLINPLPNPRQVAELRWFEANNAEIKINLDDSPSVVAFAGGFVWIANRGDDEESNDDAVTKIDAVQRQIVTDIPVGNSPSAIAFDGESIWVANRASDNLTKFRLDGSGRRNMVFEEIINNKTVVLDIIGRPTGLAFDGENMWVVNQADGNVVRISVDSEDPIDENPVTANIQAGIDVGGNPTAIAFDGENMWVTHSGTRNVTVIRASDGEIVDVITAGDGRASIVFDGNSMWLTNEDEAEVVKVRASDRKILGTFDVRQRPTAMTFDGSNIWVVNKDSKSVTKLRAADGSRIGDYPVGRSPSGIAFDGANIWVSNQDDDNVFIK